MPRQPCIDTRILPADVFAIRDEVFYDLVTLISGSKIPKLLKWQELSNAATFLMCPDPLEFLHYESNDIIQLKQETCLKLNDNSFIVLPGIRSGCDELRALLSKKRDEEAKGSNRHNPHAILTPVHPSSLPLVALPSVTTTVSSPLLLPLALTSIQSRLTTKSIVDHLASINKNIQDWIEKIKVKLSIPRLLLVDATDYRIEVAPAMDSAYIVCQCGVRSTLGKYKESFVVCPKLPQFEWRMRGSHAHSDSQSERREKLSDNLS